MPSKKTSTITGALTELGVPWNDAAFSAFGEALKAVRAAHPDQAMKVPHVNLAASPGKNDYADFAMNGDHVRAKRNQVQCTLPFTGSQWDEVEGKFLVEVGPVRRRTPRKP